MGMDGCLRYLLLLRRSVADGSVEDVKGIAYFKDGEVVANPMRQHIAREPMTPLRRRSSDNKQSLDLPVGSRMTLVTFSGQTIQAIRFATVTPTVTTPSPVSNNSANHQMNESPRSHDGRLTVTPIPRATDIKMSPMSRNIIDLVEVWVMGALLHPFRSNESRS